MISHKNHSTIQEYPNNQRRLTLCNDINTVYSTITDYKVQNANTIEAQRTIKSDVDAKNNLIKTKSTYNSLCFKFLQILVTIALGFLFGWAMEKSKVYEPDTVKKQMTFERFILLKMFLSAVAASTLSILLLNLLFKNIYNEIYESYSGCLQAKSFLILIPGAMLLGVGMQVSGACPGMVLVQLGAGVPWSYLTFIGGLCGALLHGLLNSRIVKNLEADLILSKTIAQLMCNIHPMITRVAMILLLGTGVFLIEFFIPWFIEYPNGVVNDSANVLLYKAWPPSICGVLLGLLQFFSILVLRKSIGTSGSYSTIVGVPFFTKQIQEKFPYLAKFRVGWTHWLSVLFIASVILGGFTSAYITGVFGKSKGNHPYSAFFGGIIMVFGAKLAGGCTSGHGISGTSHLFFGSFLATASMFGGGIIIGFYTLLSSK